MVQELPFEKEIMVAKKKQKRNYVNKLMAVAGRTWDYWAEVR
jgi:hypothetical protein